MYEKVAQMVRDSVSRGMARRGARNKPTGLPTAPYYYKDLQKYLMGDRQYPTSYLMGEVDEFVQELEAGNVDGINEELQDVLFGAQMLASGRVGDNRQILGADDKIAEFIRRVQVAQQMFDSKNVPFNVDYLSGGSNFKKPEKIISAFNAAGVDLDLSEAEKLRDRYMVAGQK